MSSVSGAKAEPFVAASLVSMSAQFTDLPLPVTSTTLSVSTLAPGLIQRHVPVALQSAPVIFVLTVTIPDTLGTLPLLPALI